MSIITFTSTPSKIGTSIIILLPKSASAKLPSRGMVMVEGTINGVDFQAPAEPDGNGSHWFYLDKTIQKSAGVRVGKAMKISISPSKDWPEPTLPPDIKKGISTHKEAFTTWKAVTPKAKWEWLRWIRSTNSKETREKRIVVACDKLKKGMKRPCCFNSGMCTDMKVCKSGVLQTKSS